MNDLLFWPGSRHDFSYHFQKWTVPLERGSKETKSPKAQAAGIYCSVNRSLTDVKVYIAHSEKSLAEITVLFLSHSCICPRWGSRGKHWDTLSKYWKAQLPLFCIVFHWFLFTVLANNIWAKKDCSSGNSVRRETAWVWAWEGLFTCTKWHIDLFDMEEVNSNHCPWRHKPSFRLKVLQSQALRHCTQPHRDCSVQQAVNRQDGSLQTPNPLPLVPSDPIFCSKPQGKSCQPPSRAKQSLETVLQAATLWTRSPDPRDNRAPVPASASGTHHFKVWAHEPTEVIPVPPVQLGTHTTTTKKVAFWL